jgi:hypothetical protein
MEGLILTRSDIRDEASGMMFRRRTERNYRQSSDNRAFRPARLL